MSISLCSESYSFLLQFKESVLTSSFRSFSKAPPRILTSHYQYLHPTGSTRPHDWVLCHLDRKPKLGAQTSHPLCSPQKWRFQVSGEWVKTLFTRVISVVSKIQRPSKLYPSSLVIGWTGHSGSCFISKKFFFLCSNSLNILNCSSVTSSLIFMVFISSLYNAYILLQCPQYLPVTSNWLTVSKMHQAGDILRTSR